MVVDSVVKSLTFDLFLEHTMVERSILALVREVAVEGAGVCVDEIIAEVVCGIIS